MASTLVIKLRGLGLGIPCIIRHEISLEYSLRLLDGGSFDQKVDAHILGNLHRCLSQGGEKRNRIRQVSACLGWLLTGLLALFMVLR